MAALGLFVGLVVNTALRYAADGTRDATAQRTRERAEGSHFSLRRFHDKVLGYGSIPVPLIAELME